MERRKEWQIIRRTARIGLSVALILGTEIILAPALAQNLANEPIKPLPPNPALDAAKVELGFRIFHDPRFSDEGTVSCASCHAIALGGADRGKRVSEGVRQQNGTINAPSVLTAAYNSHQFWDGRSPSLENQITHVLTNPLEFASDWPAAIQRFSQDADLLRAVRAVYGEAPSQRNLSDAVATYERSLPEASRFDRFLRGESSAITAEERQGYEKFKSYGCVACHQGVNVGGNMFQRLGTLGNYFADRGTPETGADLGRFNVTGKENDRYVFKVPSLRNVALTAPYFHDGAAATLEEAIRVMFKYQLGRTAPVEDQRLIALFLRALTAQSIEESAIPAMESKESKP
ncbi:MAG: cytochrome B6 [Zoogloeaceae bacterium]|jgi:cytochrome c peroxidase|nr:cytochrome B6 [Zoogloeaceae bacterium]